MRSKLFVGNISFDTNHSDLEELFRRAGTVCSAVVIQNGRPHYPSGFAFITMATWEEANAAITRFDGWSLRGCLLRVTEATRSARAASEE